MTRDQAIQELMRFSIRSTQGNAARAQELSEILEHITPPTSHRGATAIGMVVWIIIIVAAYLAGRYGP